MFGCYESMLLPKCVQLLTRAYITINLIPKAELDNQNDCIYRLLDRLPGLTSLHLIMQDPDHGRIEFPIPHWSFLFPLLPQLRQLCIEGFRCDWEFTFKPILQNQTSLIKLEIDGVMQWGEQLEHYIKVYFSFTPKRRDSIDEGKWLAVNSALRLELCDYLIEYMQYLSEGEADISDVEQQIDECKAIKSLAENFKPM